MRWTRSLIPTLREDPQEAEIASHKLMLRAGLIQQLVAGGYSFLPLGFRALHKVTNIIREEMDRAGAAEVVMPVVHPQELWQETGRVDEYGSVLAKFSDRRGSGMLLAPTHEESVTDMVRRSISSYKQLPFTLYQIQTKYRDEARPRYGLFRTREFLMKDAYSFDATQEGLDASYQAMYDAYHRIFKRCGIPFLPVDADSGSIGGSASCEFMAPCEVGEDLLVQCEACGYGGNMEKAPTMKPSPFTGEQLPSQEIHTPGQKTIQELDDFIMRERESNAVISTWLQQARQAAGCSDADSASASPFSLKTLLYHVDGEVVMVLIHGGAVVNEVKLANAFGGRSFEPASEEQAKEVLGSGFGSLGPVGVNGKAKIFADHGIRGMGNMVCGANKDDYHLIGVNLERDFQVDEWVDIRSAQKGEQCAATKDCKGHYSISTGSEVGHVFKLGTRYSHDMKATFLDQNGSSRDIIMGCYGIGVSRIVATSVEVSKDDAGIVWPISIAPYEAVITVMDPKKQDVMDAAEEIYNACKDAGLDTLLDDRDARPGVKLNDADLIGIPIRIAIGKRGLKEGKVEIKRRDHDRDATETLPLDDIAARAQAMKLELFKPFTPDA